MTASRLYQPQLGRSGTLQADIILRPSSGLIYFYPDHVTSIGCQMTNSVLNFESLLLLCFFNRSRVLKFGAPSRYYKVALTQKR
jgi:hypothetical protein